MFSLWSFNMISFHDLLKLKKYIQFLRCIKKVTSACCGFTGWVFDLYIPLIDSWGQKSFPIRHKWKDTGGLKSIKNSSIYQYEKSFEQKISPLSSRLSVIFATMSNCSRIIWELFILNFKVICFTFIRSIMNHWTSS